MSDKTKRVLEIGAKVIPFIIMVGLLALTAKMDDRYVQKQEFRDYKETLRDDLREIRGDVKELLRRGK